ncbi:MAG: hypothetical protein GY708_18785 [Actinomycetia bacterium]|nr:hypothetical protein [Actinomycetes bacterium]
MLSSIPADEAAAVTGSAATPEPKAITSDGGYWMLGDGGEVYAFGDAADFGDATDRFTNAGFAALLATPTGQGYWILSRHGSLWPYGDAATLDHPSGSRRSGELVSFGAVTPSGNGVWAFTDTGRVIAVGDAEHHGDMDGIDLAGSVVAAAVTSSGSGYYMIGSDGGVFSFGDAVFRGSVRSALNGGFPAAPVVGIVPTPDNSGYWLVGADGGVFSFGAPFRGSIPGVLPPGTSLAKPINGMVAYGDGYLMAASDGGVFTFSDKAFLGSLGADPPEKPIVGITPLPSAQSSGLAFELFDKNSRDIADHLTTKYGDEGGWVAFAAALERGYSWTEIWLGAVVDDSITADGQVFFDGALINPSNAPAGVFELPSLELAFRSSTRHIIGSFGDLLNDDLDWAEPGLDRGRRAIVLISAVAKLGYSLEQIVNAIVLNEVVVVFRSDSCPVLYTKGGFVVQPADDVNSVLGERCRNWIRAEGTEVEKDYLVPLSEQTDPASFDELDKNDPPLSGVCEYVSQFGIGLVCADGVQEAFGSYAVYFLEEETRTTDCFNTTTGSSVGWEASHVGSFRVTHDFASVEEAKPELGVWKLTFTVRCLKYAYMEETWAAETIVSNVDESYARAIVAAIGEKVEDRTGCGYFSWPYCEMSNDGLRGTMTKANAE